MPSSPALSDPARAASGNGRSWGFLLVFALANAGGVIGYLPLLTLLLPMKVAQVAGDAAIGVFTTMVVAGAIAASVSNIVFGWLSDRSVARGGGRRRWMAGGLVATALAYAAIAAAQSVPALVLAVVAFQAAINIVLAPLLAIMADEVPDRQKGVAGGLLALANPLASALSALLLGATRMGEAARFAMVPVAVAAFAIPLLLTRARASGDPAPVTA